MNFRRALLALAIPALLIAGCGDDDDDGGDETATATDAAASSTATASETGETGPTPTRTSTPTPTANEASVQDLARSPAYFIYPAREGDTTLFIANVFDGEFEVVDGFEAEFMEASGLNHEPQTGRQLAIPLRPGIEYGLVPAVSLAAYLGEEMPLLVPGDDLVELYLGRLELHKVELGPDDNPGFAMEFGLTDRPAFSGDEPDTDARVVGLAFTLAAGSMRDGLEVTAQQQAHDFERDGVGYTLVLPRSSEFPPEQVEALLEGTADED